jgi:hypothetical protein
MGSRPTTIPSVVPMQSTYKPGTKAAMAAASLLARNSPVCQPRRMACCMPFSRMPKFWRTGSLTPSCAAAASWPRRQQVSITGSCWNWRGRAMAGLH